jgi:hypothetical protein
MISSHRYTVLVCVRGLAVVAAVGAVAIVLARVIWALQRYELPVARNVLFQSSTYQVEIRWGGLLLLVAVLLWLFQRPLARFIAPAGDDCPECGYSLRKLKSPRCPECGWEIPKDTPA